MPTIELGIVYKGSESGKIVKAQGGTRQLGDYDVVIDQTHSGLCGTDLHYRKADLCLGHEGVGIVSQVGPKVKHFKKSDRVGYGYVHDACLTCFQCQKGDENQCPEKVCYGQGDKDFGGFSQRAVIREQFVHAIPDKLPLEFAAPLQCAGATCLGSIFESGITSFSRVGVLGIGGLGHLAIQFLSKMGCDVVAFSGSNNKKDEAMKLGAHEFVAAKDNPKLEGVKPIDYLVVTTSAQPDWDVYFNVMAPGGKILPLSVDSKPMTHPYGPILSKELTIKGTFVSTRAVHRMMLEFAALHDIRPIIEKLPMNEQGLNEAADRLEKGDVRYRFVLVSEINKE